MGFIKQKLVELRQLATRAEHGEEITEKMCLEKVNTIIEHIKICKDVDPNENLKRFKWRLKITIDTVHKNQPKYKEILEICFSLFPDRL